MSAVAPLALLGGALAAWACVPFPVLLPFQWALAFLVINVITIVGTLLAQ